MLFKDVRYGLRLLTRAPAFTAVVLLSLAVGAGAASIHPIEALRHL